MAEKTANDNRFHTAWDNYREGKIETEEFDSPTHGPIAFSAFAAGWRARYEEAKKAVGNTVGDEDLKILHDQMKLLQKEYNRAWEEVFKWYGYQSRDQRIIRALRTQIEEMGGNPEDAPLYRRITNQRQELKALNKVIENLKSQLADKDHANTV